MHQAFIATLGQRYGLPSTLRITEHCGESELTVLLRDQPSADRLWKQLSHLSRAAERLDCLWLRIDLAGKPVPYRRCPLEWALFFRAEDPEPKEQQTRKSERG